MTLRALMLVSLFWTSSVQAQADLRVVLLGSEPADPGWERSLQTELGAEGGELIRDARAPATDPRAQARQAGADAAVWIDTEGGVLRVHALVVDAPRTLVAVLDVGRDSRTVALVVVSLLEEARAATTQPASRRVHLIAPSSLLDAPLPDRPASSRYRSWAVEERVWDAPTPSEPTEPTSQVYAAFGIGTSALISDVAFDLGALLRTVLGVRLGDVFRLQANLEGGLLNESLLDPFVGLGGSEAQPFLRLCPELALAPRVGAGTRFWVGVHGCGGITEARHYVYQPDVLLEEGLITTLAAGGFAGVDFSIADGMNLWIRADLDGTIWVDVIRQPNVLLSLSTMLEIF